jgi:hypothetical protein
LEGSPKLLFDLAEYGDTLEGDERDGFRKKDEPVESVGKFGFGTGRGFKYLSSGFIVRYSELVELTLPFRLRLPEPIWVGTWRTFTVWPGRRGHDVVEGSAGL